jgi:crotonobetainyl-CoA:carnitine CoA-transferase CaiB-like acyl-CoA transferase
MQVIDVLAFSHIGFVVDSIDGFRATWGALLGLGSVDFWALHKEHRAVAGPGDLPTELAAADVVLCDASTGPPPWLTRQRLPKALWVTISPYGSAGPRARWRGSELTCLAASGNLYVTGDPDRPPVGCSRPTATPHAGVEAAVATLFGLAAGAREVDMSAQEAVMSANMTAPGAYRALRPRGVGAPARHHARHRPVSGQRVAAPDGAVARVPVDQRRKLSVRSNAKSAEGLALIRRLVIEWADLVIENFTAGVLPRWGLGYESVSAQRPDLVMISTNLWGD